MTPPDALTIPPEKLVTFSTAIAGPPSFEM
jgi:hypothetical protein